MVRWFSRVTTWVRALEIVARSKMATSGGTEPAVGQPHLAKQDLSTLVSVHECVGERERCAVEKWEGRACV